MPKLLPKTVESLDGLDESVQGLYQEAEDGKGYELTVEVQDTKNQLDEFRKNNRSLNQQIQDLQKQYQSMEQQLQRFGDVDPETVQEALEAKKRLDESKEGDLIKEGKIDEVVKQRTQQVKDNYQQQLDQMRQALQDRDGRLQNLHGQLSQTKITSGIQSALSSAGVQPRKGAMNDILNRAHASWQVNDNGEIEPRDESSMVDGEGNEIKDMNHYVASLAKSAPYLFEQGGGGGAGGGQKGGGKNNAPTTIRSDGVKSKKDLQAIATGRAKYQHN